MQNVKPVTVLIIVGAVTVVLLVAVLVPIFLSGNVMLMTSQRCNAGMENINCSGSVGQLRGTSRLDFYDAETAVSWRSSNWNADIGMSIEEGELVMEITNLDGEMESFTITPENPLQANVAVNRSLSGKISAQLAAQGEGEETPVVRGINWETNFTAR